MAKAPKNVPGAGQGHYIQRKQNKAVSEIYDYYAGIETPMDVTDDECERFKTNLLKVKTILNCRQLAVQGEDKTSDAEPYFIRTMLPRDVATSFFHFRRQDGSNTHRLYANIHKHGRLKTFLNLSHRLWNVNDFLCGKVAGPAAKRADTAVFYFKSKAGLDNGVQAITNYARGIPERFGQDRPKLTMPVPGLLGFGIGTQPPKIQIMRQAHNDFVAFGCSQSFGTYRAHVIFMALENSTISMNYSPLQAAYCSAFKKRAKNYLTVAGIDPDHPWRQGAPRISGTRDASEVLRRIGTLNENGVDTGWPIAA
ncbi:MAG: hypothetical protein AAGB11_18720 [Pseudomonadota bacterium]